MVKPSRKSILTGLLSNNREAFEQAFDELDLNKIPNPWIEPLMKVYLDPQGDYQNRERLLWIFNRQAESVLRKAFEKCFFIDPGWFVDCGEGFVRDMVSDLAPNYCDSPVLKKLIEEYLAESQTSQMEADAFFQGIDEQAIGWLEDRFQVPRNYNVPHTCATCSHYYPTELGEGGVLGDCEIHSAEQGLFRHSASCDQWSRRKKQS